MRKLNMCECGEPTRFDQCALCESSDLMYNQIMKKEEMINRIESVGIRADDIKHKDRLTQEQIASISDANAYEWIRVGIWKKRDFLKWLDARNQK